MAIFNLTSGNMTKSFLRVRNWAGTGQTGTNEPECLHGGAQTLDRRIRVHRVPVQCGDSSSRGPCTILQDNNRNNPVIELLLSSRTSAKPLIQVTASKNTLLVYSEYSAKMWWALGKYSLEKNSPMRWVSIVSSTQMNTLRLREVRCLVQSHRASSRAGHCSRSGSAHDLDRCALGLVIGKAAMKCSGEGGG